MHGVQRFGPGARSRDHGYGGAVTLPGALSDPGGSICVVNMPVRHSLLLSGPWDINLRRDTVKELFSCT